MYWKTKKIAGKRIKYERDSISDLIDILWDTPMSKYKLNHFKNFNIFEEVFFN